MKSKSVKNIDQLFGRVKIETLDFKTAVLAEENRRSFYKKSLTLAGSSAAGLLTFFFFLHMGSPRHSNSFIPLDQINDYTEQMTVVPESSATSITAFNGELPSENGDIDNLYQN